MSKDTISVSEIKNFLADERYSGYSIAAAKGMEMHRKIELSIESGDIPDVLKNAGLHSVIGTEQPYSLPIARGLFLTCKVDVMGNLPVDIKSHSEIKGRDLLQAAYEGMITRTNKAAVYLPKSRKACLIVDGGRSADDELKFIANSVATIFDNYSRIKEIEKTGKRNIGRPDSFFAIHAQMQGRDVSGVLARTRDFDSEKIALAKEAARLTRELNRAKESAMNQIQRRGNLVMFN